MRKTVDRWARTDAGRALRVVATWFAVSCWAGGEIGIPSLVAEEMDIVSVAGTGKAALGPSSGASESVAIGQPFGVEIGPDGGLYICEVENHRVLRLDRRESTVRPSLARVTRATRAMEGPPSRRR